MNVLEIENLYKTLGKTEIIKGINLSIKQGEIFGFLGPNGAGKTTTIRMLVGLIQPSNGEIRICGYDLNKNKEKALKNVGAVVENPELYKYLSGRENLMQIARIRSVSKKEVEELVKLVGLEKRIDDKVSKYSLGMKQRLGLAVALMGNPKLLILDEPTNGLDPTGILEFRELIKKASKEKEISVFISSHILSEIQNLCDKVAFINEGVIQSIEKMDNKGIYTGKDDIILKTKHPVNAVLDIIKTLPYVIRSKINGDEIVLLIEKDMTSKLIKKLVSENIEICEVYKNKQELEERYMELMNGGSI
ncbi:ABC transporter ATP-binding protein [Clostridium botulinum]|uniref:Bacitracin transport ATP-binding protein BcrA n=1 Tax=Clostridium botulinum (strain Eklund 17B / Type B) TaxID=935198 RepID=B2TR50_CLOBB|nr:MULTISPECIES: ABC transporter ATP-binding protein [Clostridium]ACD23603.1 putative bacitracin transport ATP-binding protein BcrA [Clostridium botulinum B str. Eklund 17B (NRP)]KAI3344839.1 ABC transporter ATP-binding protein [Clostridium botulinum]KFX54430.1 bacitracin ABC transporter ATP-binding protein [Clostridium botulinum]KFX59270.1 bacitracin ABC transporter ATP-binding protein [Clostridium botulinum]KON11674.1 bacitracin ABC transporter ATP-binding protein [Clostridium botulinum]